MYLPSARREEDAKVTNIQQKRTLKDKSGANVEITHGPKKKGAGFNICKSFFFHYHLESVFFFFLSLFHNEFPQNICYTKNPEKKRKKETKEIFVALLDTMFSKVLFFCLFLSMGIATCAVHSCQARMFTRTKQKTTTTKSSRIFINIYFGITMCCLLIA